MGRIRLRPGFALPYAAAVLAATLAPIALRAQAPQTAPAPSPPTAAAPASLPSARSVIDRHVAAIGGRAAVLGHSSTRATGEFSVVAAGMKGTLEVFAAKPDKSLVKINIPGVGNVVEAYNGTHG